MIERITSNIVGFHPVTFEPHFNLVLANQSADSSNRDTRNGVGKSLLLEAIHFCLGSTPTTSSKLSRPELESASFTLTLVLGEQRLVVKRAMSSRSKVDVSGDIVEQFSVAEWTKFLGSEMFGLDPDADTKAQPSFRGVISYLIRSGSGAYLDPFKTFPQQAAWQTQLCVAFLLSLNPQIAYEWHVLAERKKALKQLLGAARSGQFDFLQGNVGELEARKVIVSRQIDELRQQLAAFNVHPEYELVQREANEVTGTIAELSNQNNSNLRMLRHYQSSLVTEQSPSTDQLVRLYQEAGAQFGDALKRDLHQVEQFHHELIDNRRSFLESEIRRLERSITDNKTVILQKENRRTELLVILQSHGALETYSRLNERLQKLLNDASQLQHQIETINELHRSESDMKIEEQLLYQKAVQDYDERRSLRERAVRQFEEVVEALYNEPGSLIMEVTQAGYKFATKIERKGSEGVDRMTVFAFDASVAALLADRREGVLTVAHDSTLFDGVDERQKASALRYARDDSERRNYQYIALLNSDAVPRQALLGDLNVDDYTRLTLTDADPSGSLFGFRF